MQVISASFDWRITTPELEHLTPQNTNYRAQEQTSNPERTLDCPPVWQVRHEKAP
jgi:hypothetical protein